MGKGPSPDDYSARLPLPQEASDFGSATIQLQSTEVGLWGCLALAVWAGLLDWQPGTSGAGREAPRVSLEVVHAAL